MGEMAPEFKNLEIAENIFKSVKFFISGEVHEKVVELLKCGGAERLNYFSDYVTHLIVGENPEENDIVDANDVYEIPALTPKWVLMSASLKRLVSTKPYLYAPNGKLLSNLTFCFSNIREDRNYLWSLITYNGGVVQLNLNKECNYLVTTEPEGAKYEKAESLGSDFIKIVSPDWVVETVRNKSFADYSLFHPKLIDWPKPVKHESTTAITGFEPEQSDVVEPAEEKAVSDSTQALLDKLKQRMPWNQPNVSSTSETIAPPNVVAPSFIQKQQLNQVSRSHMQLPTSQPNIQVSASTAAALGHLPNPTQSLVNTPIPRSIVHHTPTSQNQQEQMFQARENPLNISRLISQNQPRANLQHLRGEFQPTQSHQQILQQRIQQQNIIQRGTSGQVSLQQRLLQQQLNQNQISEPLLQNQLSQGSTLQQSVVSQQQKIQSKQTLSQLGQQHLNILQQHQLQLKQQNQQQTITNNQQLQNQQQLNQQQLNQQIGSLNQSPKVQVSKNSQLQLGQNQVHLHQNQQQIRLNQNQQQLQQLQLNQNQQIQLNQNQQQIQLNQSNQQLQLNQQQIQVSSSQAQQQLSQNQQLITQNQQQLHLSQNQQHLQLNQTNQQLQLNQNQQLQQQLQLSQGQQQLNTNQQLQMNQNPQQLQLNQNQQQQIQQQQLQMNQNQQQLQQLNQNTQLNQNQQQLQQLNQNSQLNQNQQQLQQLNQNSQLNQNQQQLQINPNQQQLQLSQNQQQMQLNQSQQQIQLNQNQQQIQLNQREQQIQLNQNQQQIQLNPNQQQIQLNQNQQEIQVNQNQVLNQNQQQILVQNQQIQLNPNQIQISQNQQVMNQQLIQNTPTNQVTQHQINQQQIQLGQGQSIIQQNINQHILSKHNQQLLQQKQQFLNQQQQAVSNQQQIIQNSPNLIQQQQQFVSSNFNQNQNVSQEQQIIGQQQNIGQQMTVQTLNQQLSTQNLGQQLNQQQLSQHLNQQNQLNQQLNHAQIQNQQLQSQQITQDQIGQPISQNQLNSQQLNIQLQQQQQLNRQQQLQVQQQNLSQQNLQPQHQLNQITQQGAIPQQVVRAQFQQQPAKIGQQILVNQTSPQTPQPQRAQIGQQLWTQQQSQVSGQQIIRHPVNVVQQGPRVQWSPNSQQGNAVPQRQYIQLDARTHNELQKMSPEQQAQFVAKLQRHRQLQQRGGHILIRGNVPPGLTTQQQVQWLQQQAKQQGIVLPPNIQQNITAGTLTQPGLTQNVQHGGAPGLSPINQNAPQFTDQNQQQQLQLRQYRLHQLQLQREQAQKNHLAQQQQGAAPQPAIVRPIGQPQLADSTTNPPQVQEGNIQHSLVVNAKTKTALANMLSIKLQSGSSSVGVQRPEPIPEPSAAGTLRLMTAQHNAALISKPQEIIALQRRTISGPNGEIIRPPGPPQPPVPPANDTKIPFTAKSSLPLQHRPGPFYGHNPNLKLPPDLFLLGCIFVVVEIENVLEEEMPGWQQNIEKYGGEVEKQYCSRVTHVLCETQRHGVVMQALRDCKRCVTIVWLSDVIQRKQVLPPWTALHLPNIYLDTSPACKHLISITGFESVDRQRVKQMIRYTGAKCTSYLSKHNTLLISAKADGRKCGYAKKWQIPIVNVQWLTDIMLGHFTALNQTDHQMYQQYPTPPNFSFDPKLVPNLMVAWKAPINISQESYERVKRSASPVVIPKKPKKPKTEATDENDNISEEQPLNATHKILFSMISETKEMQKVVNGLGGAVAKDHQDFTHLVMSHLARSNKLFFAIAKGAHVVSDQWLKDSQESNQFLPETNYNLNPKEFNYEYKCDIEQTLQTKNRDKLLEGKFFYITPSVFPSRKILSELVTCSGGVVERIRRSAAQIEATNANSPYSYFIITHENDLHLVADLLKNKKDKVKMICNAELIFSAILRQTFEVDPYSVCVL